MWGWEKHAALMGAHPVKGGVPQHFLPRPRSPQAGEASHFLSDRYPAWLPGCLGLSWKQWSQPHTPFRLLCVADARFPRHLHALFCQRPHSQPSCLGPRSPEGGLQVTHQWAILRSPLVSSLEVHCYVWCFVSLCHFLDLAVQFQSTWRLTWVASTQTSGGLPESQHTLGYCPGLSPSCFLSLGPLRPWPSDSWHRWLQEPAKDQGLFWVARRTEGWGWLGCSQAEWHMLRATTDTPSAGTWWSGERGWFQYWSPVGYPRPFSLGAKGTQPSTCLLIGWRVANKKPRFLPQPPGGYLIVFEKCLIHLH